MHVLNSIWTFNMYIKDITYFTLNFQNCCFFFVILKMLIFLLREEGVNLCCVQLGSSTINHMKKLPLLVDACITYILLFLFPEKKGGGISGTLYHHSTQA